MKTFRFKARIEKAGGGGAYVLFPYDVVKEFGTRARVPVKVTFDGVPYTGSLVRCGSAEHMVGILKSICEQIGKGPGDTLEVELQRDESERKVEIPAGFSRLLKKEKLLESFKKQSYTHQREYVRWVSEAKKAETQSARMAKAVEMLRAGVKSPD